MCSSTMSRGVLESTTYAIGNVDVADEELVARGEADGGIERPLQVAVRQDSDERLLTQHRKMPDLMLDHERARAPQALVEIDCSMETGSWPTQLHGIWSIPVVDPNMMPSMNAVLSTSVETPVWRPCGARTIVHAAPK